MTPSAPFLLACLLTTTLAAGCIGGDGQYDDCWRHQDPTPAEGAATATSTPIRADPAVPRAYEDMGFDGTHWPDLAGHTVRILDHGAFVGFAYEPAKAAFEALTNATVTTTQADDAGTALQLAIQDQATGGSSFDILYGVDNVLMGQAVEADIFQPYTPLLAPRVGEAFRFAPLQGGSWVATPVDHGYIAVNTHNEDFLRVDAWDDLVENADTFVTQDPRFSSPGLGFLLATVAAFGQECYLGFWEDLYEGGLLVTSGWTEAYVLHFSAGFGHYEPGNPLDRAMVTSYTTSPAYEAFYDNEIALAGGIDVLLAPQSTFQQIQTMGILRGTPDLAAAQAWIEFTLSDAYQVLQAEYNAIYPVVSNDVVDASVEAVYGGRDSPPGSFTPAALPSEEIAVGVEDWVAAWTDLHQTQQA